jgi:hypothetical protein
MFLAGGVMAQSAGAMTGPSQLIKLTDACRPGQPKIKHAARTSTLFVDRAQKKNGAKGFEPQPADYKSGT